MSPSKEKGITSVDKSDTLNSGLPSRLKEVRAFYRHSQKEMSESLHIGKNSWQNYESGAQVPGSQVITALVHLGFNANWILTGEGPMRIEALLKSGEGEALHVYAPIPHRVREEAGEEIKVESEIASLALNRKWLEQKDLSPKDVICTRMSDDSMQPTIPEGGLVIIDGSTDKLRGDGIYALMHDGSIAVKRLQIELGGGLWLRPDNPTYREQHIQANDVNNLYIIGKVIWVGGEV